MKKFIITLILILVCVSVFSVSTAAVYTSGDLSTNRYYSPLRFDFEIFGTTAQLTPTVSYGSGYPITYDTFEQATQVTSPSNIITSINRTNFQLSNHGQTCLDVSYRLKFNVSESVDSFTLKITAPGGIYDFEKYGIPQIAIPTGYVVEASVSYNIRFTADQISTSSVTSYEQFSSTVYCDQNFSLLKSTYTVSGESYPIISGVLVNDYEAVLVFTKQGDGSGSGQYGDPGYYLWDEVLSDFYGLLEYYQASIYSHLELSGVTLIGSQQGVVTEFELLYLELVDVDSSIGEWTIDYDVPDDFHFVAYNYSDDEWSYVEQGAEGDFIMTPIQLRCLKFSNDFFDTFELNMDREKYDELSLSEFEAYNLYVVEFSNYFRNNTTYYSESPLNITESVDVNGNVTRSFTDGDGGMYLHYYVDRMLPEEISSTYSDYYGLAYRHGFSNGDGGFSGDYAAWLGTSVSGFMDLELFPNFSIGGVLSVIVAICLLLVFLKFFSGG